MKCVEVRLRPKENNELLRVVASDGIFVTDRSGDSECTLFPAEEIKVAPDALPKQKNSGFRVYNASLEIYRPTKLKDRTKLQLVKERAAAETKQTALVLFEQELPSSKQDALVLEFPSCTVDTVQMIYNRTINCWWAQQPSKLQVMLVTMQKGDIAFVHQTKVRRIGGLLGLIGGTRVIERKIWTLTWDGKKLKVQQPEPVATDAPMRVL